MPTPVLNLDNNLALERKVLQVNEKDQPRDRASKVNNAFREFDNRLLNIKRQISELINECAGSATELADVKTNNLNEGDALVYRSGFFQNENIESKYGIHQALQNFAGFTAGSVLFVGAGPVIAEDNANFFWDDVTNRLGLSTITPQMKLQVNADATAFDDSWAVLAAPGAAILGDNATLHLVGQDSASWGAGISLMQMDISNPTDFENTWGIIRQTNGDGTGDGSLRFTYGTQTRLYNNTSMVAFHTDGDVSILGDVVIGAAAGTNPNAALQLDGTMKLKEQAAAIADTAGYGQLWAKDNAGTTELWFTQDDGTDHQLAYV